MLSVIFHIGIITEYIYFFTRVTFITIIYLPTQQETSVATEKAIHRWLEMILSFSLSENDTDTRQTTAQAVCDILPHLVSHPCITGRGLTVILANRLDNLFVTYIFSVSISLYCGKPS